MKRIFFLIIALLSVSSAGYAAPKNGYVWAKLDDGLEYARLSFSTGVQGDQGIAVMHAFRVDPSKFRIDLLTPQPKDPIGDWVESMATRSGAIIAVNGGFFTPEHNSIGLLVKSGKKINALHNTSWWSVFVIKDNSPAILPPWKAKDTAGYQMAIQAGPRLVVDGRIPELKASKNALRTALGVTDDGKVVIAATEGAGITMQDLATRMSTSRLRGGFECPNAMALDGGSSTQLYAKVGKLNLSLRGFSTVTNGVAVFRHPQKD